MNHWTENIIYIPYRVYELQQTCVRSTLNAEFSVSLRRIPYRVIDSDCIPHGTFSGHRNWEFPRVYHFANPGRYITGGVLTADEWMQILRRGHSFRLMNTSLLLRRSCQLVRLKVSALASSYRYLLSIRVVRYDRVGIRLVNIDTDSVSAILFHRSNGLTEAVSAIRLKQTQNNSSTRNISS